MTYGRLACARSVCIVNGETPEGYDDAKDTLDPDIRDWRYSVEIVPK